MFKKYTFSKNAKIQSNFWYVKPVMELNAFYDSLLKTSNSRLFDKYDNKDIYENWLN